MMKRPEMKSEIRVLKVSKVVMSINVLFVCLFESE